MIALQYVFYIYVFILVVIGGMRGWAKELLVTFSVILGMFIILVLEEFVPNIKNILTAEGNETLRFWVRFIIIFVTAFFGYQTPGIAKIVESKLRRDKLQDVLLGVMIGALNGYLLIGSLWFYLHNADYFLEFVNKPDVNTIVGQQALEMVERMAPVWLGVPEIYFAIAVAFAFLIIVFV